VEGKGESEGVSEGDDSDTSWDGDGFKGWTFALSVGHNLLSGIVGNLRTIHTDATSLLRGGRVCFLLGVDRFGKSGCFTESDRSEGEGLF
jgi:hypothetical protein